MFDFTQLYISHMVAGLLFASFSLEFPDQEPNCRGRKKIISNKYTTTKVFTTSPLLLLFVVVVVEGNYFLRNPATTWGRDVMR